MKASILAIGNELVTGQTVDTNSPYLAEQLAARGIETCRHATVRDDRHAIAAAILQAAGEADLVLITGGLGPTADDLTRQGLADALGAELVLDEASLEEIGKFFRRRGREMTAANSAQAMVPAGAEPIHNRMGTAPGIAAEIDGAQIFVTPGVPIEMECMYAEQIAPRLPAELGVVRHHIVHTMGVGESDLGATIGDLMARDANPLVGTTASAGSVGIRITACAARDDQARELIERTVTELRRRLGDLVIGEGEQTLASVVGDLLRAAGQTLATAESCTGGMIGERITAAPGASDYYLGGVVAYANAVKRQALSVPQKLLEAHGAVSEPVAAAMADGCRAALGSDWALGITGIAGPAGGSEDKPVGLVYIGLAGPEGTTVHRHVLPGTRDLVRHRAALLALDHLRRALL